MTFTLYLLDELEMPPDPGEAGSTLSPAKVISLIREKGGFWSDVDAGVEDYSTLWETLDRFAGGSGFLSELAFSGSPNLLLVGRPGKWRLGYFEASLVEHLVGAFRLQADQVEPAVGLLGAGALRLWDAVRTAMDEAVERRLGVAVLF